MDKYTDATKRVLSNAREEARGLGHNYIGTEHILLGILREETGYAVTALHNLDITLEKVRGEVVARVGQGNPHQNEVGLTPRTKMIIERANVIRNHLKDEYVMPYHLLGAIVEEGEGIAAQILRAYDFSLQDLREAMGEVREEPEYLDDDEDESGEPENGAAGQMLSRYATDLTRMALEDRLDPVIGRDKELSRIIQILSRRTKNNPVIVGEPGVGKTAIAEGLAIRIAEKSVPELLLDKRVLTLDLPGMIAGAKFRGEFEERLKKTMKEIRQAGNIILFIDEIHTLIGAGAAEGAIDAANILKPSLARGDLQCVGATTLEEYRKHIEKDAALERRFQPVVIEEPSLEDSVAILKGLRDKYEAHHKISISDGAIEAAVHLSHRYLPDRFLPDKAIDVMDESAARLKLTRYVVPPDLNRMEEELEAVKKEKAAAISSQNFEEAARLRDRQSELATRLEEIRASWDTDKAASHLVLEADEIAITLAGWTGIPVARMEEAETKKLLALEERLHNRVVGQDEAVTAVSKAIRRARAGLKNQGRPVGSFIFLGPTGVGKTELAKALAAELFGTEDDMIRIDMSEYMEKHTVSRLIGAPPGYVGHDEAGQLTEALRRKPYSVVLFDEVEKAHPDVFNILLQVLEDGVLTDTKGRKASFRNAVIIMTSNVGVERIRREKTVGFVTPGQDAHRDMKDKLLDELKKAFRPEFVNRLDDIIVFHSLDQAQSRSILTLMINQINGRLKERGMEISVTPAMEEYLLTKGFDAQYGARPLRRVLQTELEDRLADGLLEGTLADGDRVIFGYDGTAVSMEKEQAPSLVPSAEE